MQDPAVSAAIMVSTFTVLVFGFVLYFLPCVIAHFRNHHNYWSIFVVNFFFGWTMIGWVAALAMALSRVDQTSGPPQYIDVNRDRRYAQLPPPPLPGAPLAPAPEKACPYCETMIPSSAKKCRACGEWVVPESERALA